MTDQRPIGYWIALLDRLIEEQFVSTIDEHGVTKCQWQLLSVLAREAATVAQLDAAIAPLLTAGSDSESSVEHLSELIESGWVDATTEAYELTERGRTAFDRLAEVVTQHRSTMVTGVSASEQDATVGVLERMARNLGWND